LDEEDRKGTAFRVAKQIVRKIGMSWGGGCMRDSTGKIVVEEDRVMEE